MSKLKNRKEFEGLKKKERKRGEKKKTKKRVIKRTLKYLYEALIPQKTPQKQGRILEGGGGRIFLAGQNIYPWGEVK